MTTFTTEDRIASYSTPQHWPLEAKTLTDEEITELYFNFYESQFIEFARAILRKAQEK